MYKVTIFLEGDLSYSYSVETEQFAKIVCASTEKYPRHYNVLRATYEKRF